MWSVGSAAVDLGAFLMSSYSGQAPGKFCDLGDVGSEALASAGEIACL